MLQILLSVKIFCLTSCCGWCYYSSSVIVSNWPLLLWKCSYTDIIWGLSCSQHQFPSVTIPVFLLYKLGHCGTSQTVSRYNNFSLLESQLEIIQYYWLIDLCKCHAPNCSQAAWAYNTLMISSQGFKDGFTVFSNVNILSHNKLLHTIQCLKNKIPALRYDMIWHNAIQCGTILYSMTQFDTVFVMD